MEINNDALPVDFLDEPPTESRAQQLNNLPAEMARAAFALQPRPAVVVGFGGAGIAVAIGIRRKTEREVVAANGNDAARQAASSISLVGIDTHDHELMQKLELGNRFVIPREALRINERVTELNKRNPEFAASAPQVNGSVYLPGNFVDGSGQDRAKAAMGWRLFKAEGGDQSPIDRIDELCQEHLDALGPAAERANRGEFPIYLIRGTGGGTGSGLRDQVAVDLRKRLDPRFALYAVDLLPNVSALMANRGERNSVFANGAVALVETARLMKRSRAIGRLNE